MAWRVEISALKENKAGRGGERVTGGDEVPPGSDIWADLKGSQAR